MTNKYGPKTHKEVEKAVKEYNDGDLKQRGGKKVKSRKQAVAIGLSNARRRGLKVPSSD